MADNIKHTSQVSKNEEDAISLRDLLLKLGEWRRYLLSKGLIIIIAGIIGGLVGLGYSLWKKTLYKASLSFVLDEQKGGGGMGSMSSLASLVGINLGGMEGAGLFTNENIMEFIKSKRMIKKTLLTNVNFDGKEQLLIDRYVDIKGLRESWAKNPKLEGFHFVPDTNDYIVQDSLIALYYKDIIKNQLKIDKPDKKLSIMQLDIKSEDELFAKVFCETLIDNVTEFYVQTLTKKSTENLNILTKQVDSVRRELDEAIGGVAIASEANPNPNPAFQRLKVPSQKKQIDVQANTAILTELVRQQEVARLNVRNDKPLIQALDRPVLPLEMERVGKAKGMVIGGFLFGFLTVLFLLTKKLFNEIMSEPIAHEI
ncbi:MULTISPECIES: lipopolysaccharide biosynthesis protein [Olivibacter]|uniref:Lipopolysaccharide biosynthesis protein n=1 Tax=Olivibacter jilunii TaxID=985016 RepID=A0ABW6BA29_9SPHI|nr:lipopolysaccharide biosynthesis protein [Olivibacter sp. UJ_SKK_5.1]MDX3912641.1 lipopolysaccharide biosynthesis protein [Pseudosphingobacterium sp.]